MPIRPRSTSRRRLDRGFQVAGGLIRLQPVGSGEEVAPPRERLPFRPRALLLWWACESDPVTALGNLGGIGIAADASSQACLAWAADDRSAPGVLGRWGADEAFLAPSDPSGAQRLGGAVRFADDGFHLELRGESPETWRIHYLALGGSELRSAEVTTLRLDRPGSQSVRGLRSRPDFLLFLPGAGASPSPLAPGLGPAIGMATGPRAQAAAGFDARVDGTETVARGALRNDAVVALPEPSDSWEYASLAHLVSLDEDGFTLATSASQQPALPLACLALSGGRYAVGLGRSARPPRRRLRERVGFRPSGLLLFTSGLDAKREPRDIGRLCVGAAAGNRSIGSVTWSVRSRRWWPLEPRSRSTDESVLEVLDTTSGTLHAQAVLEHVDSSGFRLGWPVVDHNPRNFAYVAFGAEGDASRRPLRRPLRSLLDQ